MDEVKIEDLIADDSRKCETFMSGEGGKFGTI